MTGKSQWATIPQTSYRDEDQCLTIQEALLSHSIDSHCLKNIEQICRHEQDMFNFKFMCLTIFGEYLSHFHQFASPLCCLPWYSLITIHHLTSLVSVCQGCQSGFILQITSSHVLYHFHHKFQALNYVNRVQPAKGLDTMTVLTSRSQHHSIKMHPEFNFCQCFYHFFKFFTYLNISAQKSFKMTLSLYLLQFLFFFLSQRTLRAYLQICKKYRGQNSQEKVSPHYTNLPPMKPALRTQLLHRTYTKPPYTLAC